MTSRWKDSVPLTECCCGVDGDKRPAGTTSSTRPQQYTVGKLPTLINFCLRGSPVSLLGEKGVPCRSVIVIARVIMHIQTPGCSVMVISARSEPSKTRARALAEGQGPPSIARAMSPTSLNLTGGRRSHPGQLTRYGVLGTLAKESCGLLDSAQSWRVLNQTRFSVLLTRVRVPCGVVKTAHAEFRGAHHLRVKSALAAWLFQGFSRGRQDF